MCSGGSAWLGPLIVFGMLAVLSGVFVTYKERIKRWELKNRSWLPSFGLKLIGKLSDTSYNKIMRIFFFTFLLFARFGYLNKILILIF